MSALLGLKRLREAAKPGECPLCGDPLAPRNPKGGRTPLTCGSEECRAAYHRYYARDRRVVPPTPEQRARINARRRHQYATDPEVRRQTQARARRLRAGGHPGGVSEARVLTHLEEFDDDDFTR